MKNTVILINDNDTGDILEAQLKADKAVTL